MEINHDLIRLKLNDPIFRKYINWRGIEEVLEIPKDRLKNILHQYKGYHFTDEDASKLLALFIRINSHFLTSATIKEKLCQTDIRRILNWSGIESGIGLRKHRLKNVLIGKYQSFSDEEILKIESFLKNLAIHFSNK